MRCIFCRQDAINGCKEEHIIPESVGGGDWLTLPPDVICDSCNQYFGSKIESIAISDFPLNTIRLMNGVITKKKRWAKLPHYRGIIQASPFPGILGIEPTSEEIEQAFLNGRITQLRIVAETRRPVPLCRLLLKIGLEAVAYESANKALAEKYDAARKFARAPSTSDRWWCLYHGEFSKRPFGVIGPKLMDVNIHDLGGGEVAYIEIFDFTFIVPMTPNIIPEKLEALPEPDFRFFQVVA